MNMPVVLAVIGILIFGFFVIKFSLEMKNMTKMN